MEPGSLLWIWLICKILLVIVEWGPVRDTPNINFTGGMASVQAHKAKIDGTPYNRSFYEIRND